LLENLIAKHHPNKIQLAKIDATANPTTSEILATNISGFPTLFLYDNRNRIEYLGKKLFKYL
jgi:hypothetical protein